MFKNGVILQFFQWYIRPDGTHWQHLKAEAQSLAQAGFTALWLPPAYKGSGGEDDVGYGVYDLFDLGEFDQKGSVRTKYGTKAQLLMAVQEVQACGMQVYADVVFNHKDGGDKTEEIWAQEMDWNNRNNPQSDWYPIHAYTHFTFPGRKDQYSSHQWHWWNFDSLCYNADTGRVDKLYRIKDCDYCTEVSPEKGNFDYLMACDLDMSDEFVRGELMYWGRWFVDTTGVDGFRIDAVKHIRSSFFRDWLNHLRVHFGGRELFSVGEYWSRNIDELHNYIIQTDGVMSLFDVPLQSKFHQASRAGGHFDMGRIFEGTLVKEHPHLAVTFVENHDTQPLQMLESVVESWFKPLAYVLILLRRDGYPCVFYADYYGGHYFDKNIEIWLDSHREILDKLLWARHAYGYGDQVDYFDHPDVIGWTRLGDTEHPGAMAVILSDGPEGNKWMNVERPNASFRDITGHVPETLRTNQDGWGNFICRGGSVSVWLQN
ncbi:alpha-amylase [Candidatus Cyanaurora vandensis]|uniref:alpha-amylase n=1 Tax=Candidatus Cyanaurora vandensis TaxID=2714958 RepID=UPI00257B2244|nr:alpha-amylase [Candidatus Cyanaurora vandensis]